MSNIICREGDHIKEIFINLEKEIFRGNILDVGMENHGIAYSVYKKYNNNDINLEYIRGEREKDNIKKQFYDSSIVLFSLGNLFSQREKMNLIHDIHGFLKDDGYIYIWDIDKAKNKIFNSKIKILVPDGVVKKINIKDYNILKDSSSKTTLDIVEKYFKVEDFKSSDGVYYIRAKK